MGKLFKGAYYGWSASDPGTETNSRALSALFTQLSVGDNALTDFSVTDTDSEEPIGGDGVQSHVLTGHKDATLSFAANALTTGTTGLMRYHGSNRAVYFIEAEDGISSGNKFTVYRVNLATNISGDFKGIVKLSGSGNVARSFTERTFT